MSNLISMLPFNISLLILNAESSGSLKGLHQIKVLDIFEPSSQQFHPDGLFSVEAFGKVGDERRNRLFAYIDLGTEVFHPLIYKKLCDIRELYGKIMAGTAYAKFNKQTKDFEESNALEGHTGYSFFLEHFEDLRPEERDSTSRTFAIKFINKYRKNPYLRYLVVMPAGLRDFTVKPNGQREEDEVNTFYRQALSIGNIAINSSKAADKTHLDSTRFRLQQVLLGLYQHVTNLLEGDSKMIQANWTSRNVFASSRNVITSSVTNSKKLFDELTVGPNDTVVGLYQHIRSSSPIFIKLLRDYSERVFTGPNAPAKLVNKRTLKSEMAQVDPSHYDDWVTKEGVESLLNQFETESFRSEEIVIEGYYFGLIYRDGKRFKFVQDIDDLPEGFDKKNVRPITYAELFYIASFKNTKESFCLTARYPVINYGSVYPSSIYLRTTMRSESLEELDDAWQPTGVKFNEFPIPGTAFFNSMSPSIVHLARAGADHDGDTMNYEVLMTADANEEIRNLLNSARFYVGIQGSINFSSSNDVSDLVFKELTSA